MESLLGLIAAFYGMFQKTAQSVRHHNFAIIHHRFMHVSAKCSEKNCLHGKKTLHKFGN